MKQIYTFFLLRNRRDKQYIRRFEALIKHILSLFMVFTGSGRALAEHVARQNIDGVFFRKDS